MKLKLISAILFLSFSQQGMAAYPKPESCPSVAALQAVGVSYMVKESDFWYGAVDSNHYGTSDNWTFGVGDFWVSDESEAKQQAITAMGLLRFQKGPIPLEGSVAWMCSYNDQAGHWAVAITPTLDHGFIAKYS
jgi:hypothetical protein